MQYNNYTAKKYNQKKDAIEPFLSRSMECFKIPDDDPFVRDNGEIFANGPLEAAALVDMLAMPVDRMEDVARDSITIVGGGGEKKSKQSKASNRGKELVSLDIADVFSVLPIHRIIVFGIRRGSTEMFDVTIMVYDRLNHAPTHMHYAYAIRMTHERLLDDDSVDFEIAKLLQGKCRDDFVEKDF